MREFVCDGTCPGNDQITMGEVASALGVKRVAALTAALAPSEKVELSAYGSHSTTNGGITNASFSVSVKNAN